MLQNGEVTTRLMAVDDARAAGARALFGEKYGDEVRVVSMGAGGGNTLGWSVELCGGTHVKRTGDIGLISVMGESAVASGVRRIEALTGNVARHAANASIQTAKAAAAELRTSLDDLPARVAALVEERRSWSASSPTRGRSLRWAAARPRAQARPPISAPSATSSSWAARCEDIEMKDLKSLADDGKKQIGSGVVAIVGVSADGKAGIVVGVTSDLTSRFNAVELVPRAPRCSAARAAAAVPTWRRPADRTARRRMRRWMRSPRRWLHRPRVRAAHQAAPAVSARRRGLSARR